MRLFLAIAFPRSVTLAIHQATSALREAAPSVRWVPPQNLHLTLVFLGEVDDVARDAVTSALNSVGARMGSFDLELGGIGTFPGRGRPRVVWLGADGGEALLGLRGTLAESTREAGIEVDERPYRPHVTLGRVRNRITRSERRRIRSLAETLDVGAHVRTDSVVLMRSELGQDGARYQVLERTRLRGP